MRIILIIILYIGIVSACTRKPVYPEAMSQAIRCVETQPDSALLYLDSILPSTLQAEPEETWMYYNLLKIKANDKLYHEHTSDSTIQEIVRFYDKYGDLHKQMEAYYYLGSVYRDLGDAPRAVKAFQYVTKLGEKTKEYGLIGKAYGQICILLTQQGVYDEANKAGKKELEYAILRNDSTAVGYSFRNIARIFHDQHELDSALYYYMEGYEKGAMRIKNIILSEVPWIYYDKGKPEKAKSLIFELFEKDRYSYNNWVLLGKIYQQAGELEKARDCYYNVLGKGSIYQIQSAYKGLSELETRLGHLPEAIAYANKSLAYQDSINQWTQTETVAKIQALYNFQSYEEENNRLQEANNRHQRWLLLLTCGLIVLASGGYLYYNRLLYKKARILRLARTARMLNELAYSNSLALMEDERQMIKNLQTRSQQLENEKNYLQKRLQEVENDLSSYTQLEKKGVKEAKIPPHVLSFRSSEIYHIFHQWNENSAKITEEQWQELHTAIDLTYPRFTDRLLTLYPKLSEVELQICYLIKISLPLKTIAKMLNRSNSAITNARIRMYKKLKGIDGKAEFFDQFISSL
ncbi:hypothetical protein [uncultured Parabacteroides sp.]|uniref:tetratricopeptide repeat protein n=1 Tax=uncultured Parabacteroides sp. TaxID=512312 RepID=UPI0026031FBB|nr:hypothetical protein [uncultured Parabacteroides sp.]